MSVQRNILSREIANADVLSLLPSPVSPVNPSSPANVTFMLDAVERLVSITHVQSATRREAFCALVENLPPIRPPLCGSIYRTFRQ